MQCRSNIGQIGDWRICAFWACGVTRAYLCKRGIILASPQPESYIVKDRLCKQHWLLHQKLADLMEQGSLPTTGAASLHMMLNPHLSTARNVVPVRQWKSADGGSCGLCTPNSGHPIKFPLPANIISADDLTFDP